ncbi:hypothetical protein ACFE04_012150 [Oxalis oulophora]
MLDSITSWLTPTSLFLLLNLTIATIAITTRFASNKNPHNQLGRPPSLIDRVKSINFSTYNHQPDPNIPVPSFLNRVRSINFSQYKFQSVPHETEFIQHQPEQSNRVNGLTRSPSILERVKSNISALHWSTSISSNRSISDSGSDTDDDSDVEYEEYEEKQTHHHHVLMKKSASERNVFLSRDEEELDEVERRRPQTMKIEKTASFGGDVDAKADDFINKFKQQLKLQRMDSLMRYKDMITRKGK